MIEPNNLTHKYYERLYSLVSHHDIQQWSALSASCDLQQPRLPLDLSIQQFQLSSRRISNMISKYT